MKIAAVIPALDEERTIGPLVLALRRHVASVVVVDNGSRDQTAEIAHLEGAEVVREPRRGYGVACLSGIRHAKALGAEAALLLDGDGSDDPEDSPRLLCPLVRGEADLVLGVRTAALCDPDAMVPLQRLGNWIGPALIRLLVGARFRDLSSHKAIRMDAFERLVPLHAGHGFTVELLLRAHRERLVVREVDVRCRRRGGGRSKVSGTVRGTVRASAAIIAAIARDASRKRF